MTEEEAFKILTVEALTGFEMTITVDDIVDINSIGIVFRWIATWWNGLDQFTRDLIGGYDLTEGLWSRLGVRMAGALHADVGQPARSLWTVAR